MAANYVQVPANSSGSKMQTVQNSVGGNTVDATCVAIVTSAGASCDPPSGTGVGIAGTVNSNAADSGSPVKTGGVYNSSLPAASTGSRLDTQMDVNGRTLVAAAGTVASNAADSGNPVKVGAVFTAWGSLPAAATGARLDAQCDPTGTQKVGLAPLGTPVYASNNTVAANSAVTLTIPSAKMGFLDGFDIDGVGANTGSGLSLTITGLLGGTLTYIVGVVGNNVTPNPVFSKRFNPPLQASAVATNIVISCPSFGAGSPGQSLNGYAHYV